MLGRSLVLVQSTVIMMIGWITNDGQHYSTTSIAGCRLTRRPTCSHRQWAAERSSLSSCLLCGWRLEKMAQARMVIMLSSWCDQQQPYDRPQTMLQPHEICACPIALQLGGWKSRRLMAMELCQICGETAAVGQSSRQPQQGSQRLLWCPQAASESSKNVRLVSGDDGKEICQGNLAVAIEI